MFPHETNAYESRVMQLKGILGDVWVWYKKDQGAWYIPITDWNDHHHAKYYKYLPKDRRNVVVTAGANQGLYVRGYSQQFQHVYAFEPIQQNFLSLVRNNHRPNVYFFKACLSDTCGMTALYLENAENTGEAKVDAKRGQFHVPVMTLDSMKLPGLDLLQLDAEGHEPHIIKGAAKTIKKYKPVIISEHKLPLNIIPDHKFVEMSAKDYIYIPK